MKLSPAVARVAFALSVVVALVITFFLWTQFDAMSPLVKILFTLFLVGITVLNARQAYSGRSRSVAQLKTPDHE